MRLSQTPSVSLAKARERRKLRPPPSLQSPPPDLQRSRTRSKKKHKRLDAIRDRVIEPIEHEGSVGRSPGPVVSDSVSVRRSTRVRRPTVVSDFSPLPVKKRNKFKRTANFADVKKNEGSVDRKSRTGKRGLGKVSESPNSGDLQEMGSWGSRLRSRVRNDSTPTRETRSPVRGKRKLFKELDEFRDEEELIDVKENERSEGRVIRGTKSRRMDWKKELIDEKNEDQNTGPSNSKECNKDQFLQETLAPLNNEATATLGNTIDGGSDTIMGDGSAQGHNKMDVEGTSGLGTTVPGNDQLELPNCEPVEGNGDDADRDNSRPSKASTRAVLATNPSENDGCQDRTKAHLDELASKHIEDQNGTREAPQVIKVDKSAFALKDSKLDRLRIREGRRCGLCGGGTDGKPPKKLVRDSVDSDDELSGGSSAPEEPNYDMWDGFGDEPGWLGPLLGPIHDRFGIAGVWVHQHCAVWSPEVYFADLGCLKNVRAALFRGRALKCSRCGRPGATIGCRVDRCPKTYHLPCSRADGCIFDHRKFLIACTDHRRLFQPQGTEYLRWINRRKAKKMRSDMKKLSVDGCRKDFEAEEKWLENCGEDEEFLRREGKRLHRDITRIAPVYIGGSPSEGEKPYQGWESVAGLKDVIQCLKEVVILPLLYPEFFSNLGLTPPRGVLLHGYPGTGKTLVVRALIGACSCGDKKIAYFARKGADCLGKYVGDAERQLRLLFQVAERSQPSIIFFDEIDGLAPCRSSQQDQTHSSVVSTLLALLDGLKSRGSVIVIGATNRPEAVDPALRRPGRFDREIFFPLPSAMDRSAILSLHTQKWPKPVSGSLLKWIADQTPGFAGADLQALCTQAAMIALKRNCALHELLSAAEKYPNHGRRFPLPSFYVDERDWLAALASAPPPCSRREAGIAANGVVFSPLHKHLLPCLLQPLSYLLISLYLDGRIQLSPPVYKAAELINRVIVSAMEQKKMPTSFWQTYLHNLVQDPDVAREIERNLSRTGLLVGTFGANCDLLDDDNDCEEFEFQKLNPSGACIHPSLVQNTSYSQDCPSGFRLLVAGGPRSGQQNLASCLLHGFLGHVEIQKINLATLSLEGHGDLVQGMTRILLKCLSLRRCIIYMPRIDLWAVHAANHKSTEEESGFCQKISKPTLTAELRGGLFSSSQSWNSFVEQVDSMSTSVSFTIMATCEMPNHVIPLRIRQFFTNDVLNCKDSASSQHTIPRFLVQVDGSFSRDLVIDSSATKLLHDLVQQCVQLIHHRSHKGNTTTLKEFNIVDSLGVNLEVENCKMGNTTSNGAIDKPIVSERIPLTGNACKGNHIQQSVNEGCPLMSKASCHLESMVGPGSHKDSISRVIPNRVAKGKATLLLTIATFGYQILRYPHFAELCWATSKLKEGPCTGVNGPWKIWPFNSCIIRADNSLEKDAVGCNSINHKNRECSGAVRGLVAVGLLAYKGVYTSIREVSSEVRKVLELLVGEINKKIQGGKDRWRFLRLLSQVAYFEDMVNSWAYGLRSLDIDCEMSASNIRSVTGRTLDRDNHRCGQNPVENDACVPSVYDKSEQAANILAPEQSPTRLSNENCRYGDGFDKGISVVGISGPSEGMVPMSPCPSGLLHSDVSAGLLDSDNTLKEKNDKNHLQRSSENPMILEGTGSLKQSNGLAVMDATPLSQDAFCNLDGSFVMDNSRSGKGSAQCNGMPVSENIIPCGDVVYGPDEPVGVVNCNLRESDSLSALSEICLYKCCPECLRAVHVLIREIVIDSLKSCSTVGDVHDAVAACSVGVLAAFRKHFVAERQTNTEEFCGLGLKHGTCCEHCSCWEVGDARIRKTSNMSQGSVKRKVVPMECICHSVSREVTTVPNTSKGSHLGSGLKFFFKDSALMPSDRDRDAVLHCKFESLCLCPIIDGILMIKQRLGLMCYSQFKLA